jgi:GDP-L-fucose synthase
VEKNAKIYVAGHKGLVGSAIMRRLTKFDYTNLIYKTRDELDLRDQQTVKEFFEADRDLAFLIKDVVGYGGEVRFDSSKPDGVPRQRRVVR